MLFHMMSCFLRVNSRSYTQHVFIMEIKRSITFEIEKRRKEGELITKNVPIRCVVTFNRNRITLSTGHRIDASKFVPEKGIVKNGCFNKAGESSSEINSDLDDIRATLQNIFRQYEREGEMPSANDIKEKFKVATGRVKEEERKPISLFDIYKEFIDTVGRQNAWTKTSHYKHNSIMHLLEEFNPQIKFDDLSEDTLQDFVEFLREYKGIRNTTLNKYLHFIRQFLLWADDKGYNTRKDYRRFSPRLKGANFELKKVIYLTWEELMRIYNMYIKEGTLSTVRDVFCFCCFTGLRYSDVYNLRKTDIINGKIDIVTQKDSDNIQIELNKYSKSILDKYEDIELKNGKALPVLSNQKYNMHLKDLGKMAELDSEITEVWYEGNKRIQQTFHKWERLTTHVARKTFVVNALMLGIPPQVIMRWTGHNDLKAMKPYTHIVDKLKEDEMSKFDKI